MANCINSDIVSLQILNLNHQLFSMKSTWKLFNSYVHTTDLVMHIVIIVTSSGI